MSWDCLLYWDREAIDVTDVLEWPTCLNCMLKPRKQNKSAHQLQGNLSLRPPEK